MVQTLNFAHRGFSGRYPENTMSAFRAAVGVHGCDGIELDVQLTKDGQVVICHDERIDRTCTSNHHGLVKDYMWDQLCKMDFSYGHPELSGQCPMPSLREYFSYVQDKEIQTNIELKTSVFEYAGIAISDSPSSALSGDQRIIRNKALHSSLALQIS